MVYSMSHPAFTSGLIHCWCISLLLNLPWWFKRWPLKADQTYCQAPELSPCHHAAFWVSSPPQPWYRTFDRFYTHAILWWYINVILVLHFAINRIIIRSRTLLCTNGISLPRPLAQNHNTVTCTTTRWASIQCGSHCSIPSKGGIKEAKRVWSVRQRQIRLIPWHPFSTVLHTAWSVLICIKPASKAKHECLD